MSMYVYFSCIDIDECSRGTHECRGARMECVNREGSYSCQCHDGYQLDARFNICQGQLQCSIFWLLMLYDQL